MTILTVVIGVVVGLFVFIGLRNLMSDSEAMKAIARALAGLVKLVAIVVFCVVFFYLAGKMLIANGNSVDKQWAEYDAAHGIIINK